MAKYIKLEDAIGMFGRSGEYHADTIVDMLFYLPTIEVEEDCISKAYLEQKIENQTMSVGKDEEYWRGWNNALGKVVELIEFAPSVVPKQVKRKE